MGDKKRTLQKKRSTNCLGTCKCFLMDWINDFFLVHILVLVPVATGWLFLLMAGQRAIIELVILARRGPLDDHHHHFSSALC
jgi:hypothetical protein